VSKLFRIARAAEFESLTAFREFIDTTCAPLAGVDEALLYDLKLAVDEACSNIIKHGYAGMNPGSVILTIAPQPDRVVMTITDFGRAFEPSPLPAPDVDAALGGAELGGFGLYFIYQTMDEVDYETTEDGNHLTLIRRIPHSRPS